jgi:cell division septal protein FtsQ
MRSIAWRGKSKVITASTFSVVTLAVLAAGVRLSIHSPLFSIQALEVPEDTHPQPVSASEILALSGVEIGRDSLFLIDLGRIEQRLLQEDWISSVRLEKRFPQTLAVIPSYREPVAAFIRQDGKVSYVDAAGSVFSVVRRGDYRDLPVITGVDRRNMVGIQRAVMVVQSWRRLGLDGAALLSTIQALSDGGLRLGVSYGVGRTAVTLNYESEVELQTQLSRLKSTFEYLSKHRVLVSGVWANAGKKIVVKTALGS